MTSNQTCAKCGADLLAGAKFCRRCGAPSILTERSSVTEAETRIFQATDDYTAQTQYHDSRPTGPSYMAPNESAFPSSTATTALEPDRVKRHGILWAFAILFVLLLMFGGVMALKFGRTSSTTEPTTKIEVPPKTGIVPPVVPEPPRPPTAGKGSGSELIYPGANVTMEMTRGDEGSIRTLTTNDSVDKVTAWYTEKLKPETIQKTKDGTVLSGSKTTVVISSEEGETNVVVTDGIDR